MKISKSKQELARVISENGGWRNGSEFAWYGNQTKKGWFGISKPRYSPKQKSLQILRPHLAGSFPCRKPNNWHQTILSRAEYLHLYPAQDADGWIECTTGECPVSGDPVVDVKFSDGETAFGRSNEWIWSIEGGNGDIVAYRLHKPDPANSELCDSVKRSIPDPDEQVLTNPPSIEQLAADYRNAKDCAERKQQEADAAKADADEKLAELVAAGKAIGLALGVEVAEPELVITDFRDLRVGDEISVQHMKNVYSKSEVLVVGNSEVAVRNHAGARKTVNLDAVDWKFIRRP